MDIMYRRTISPDQDPILNLYQLEEPTILQASTTITISISMVGVIGIPTTYTVKYQKMINYSTTDGAEQTQTSSTNGITITGLVLGGLYKITTQLSNASGYGNKMEVFHTLSTTPITPAKTGSTKNVGEKITAKSLLKLTGGDNVDNKYLIAYRDFESIQLPEFNNDTIGEGAGRLVKDYTTEKFYSFGTSIIFEPLIKYTPQGAGLGFFINNSADSGYFVLIETSATAASSSTSPVKIIKVTGKQTKKLKDSQKGNRTTLDQLFAGRVYNIDVAVKIFGKVITITAYVNGFKIEATDTTSVTAKNEILDPTKKVALLGVSGNSYFDYVYADTIDAGVYDGNYERLNFYSGQFSKDFLDLSYGDMLYNATNEDVDMTKKENSFDEFGTVVREITKKTVRFGSAPSIPVKWTTGANRLASIIGQTYDNFKANVLVLNNSSITVPLSDKGVNQLSIFGNTIGFSGEIEYATSPASEYATAEPVIFESSWLQNEKDVSSLANWILSRVVNKSKIVSMKVFGNPLISVGDIITVKYDYQEFSPSQDSPYYQKIIVVKVSQRYKGGLETEIVGRTL